MSHAIITSFLTIADAQGNAYNGAKVRVYDAGTTTPKTIYTDPGLTTPAANPVVCNSSGHHGVRYIAPGTYKIATETSTGTPLPDYSWDNLDTGVAVGSGALPIASGGTGATTAATARTNLDVPSNATITAIASDVATLQSSINAIAGTPQGRLTLTSGTPVLAADVTAATTVYYTPYLGAQIPIWNGSAFVLTTFPELSIALVANHLSSTLYDFFVINDSGTVRLVTGPAWNNSGAGTSARGSGAGTTELTRQAGVPVNNNSMTARYGATTVAVTAKFGTYVGSILIDGSAGQVTCHTSFGQSRKWGLWNAYNRVPIILLCGDPTASWTYNTNTIRQSNAAAGNTLTVFSGLPEEYAKASFTQAVGLTTGGVDRPLIGIGVNSTTVTSGTRANDFGAGGGGQKLSVRAVHDVVPFIGINSINALEVGASTGGTFYGTQTDMVLRAEWRG